MNRILNVKKTFAFFLFCWSTGILSAQIYYCGLVRPDNQTEILNELLACYPENIHIEKEDLALFLAGSGDDWYSAEVPVPSGLTYTKLDKAVFFDWDDGERDDRYQVRYLNLTTGETGGASPEVSEITLLRLSPAFYVSLFSTIVKGEGIGQKSADYIIIDEKPILAPVAPETFEPGYEPFSCVCSPGAEGPEVEGSSLRKSTRAEESTFPDLKIYPNPNSGEFQLVYSLPKAQSVAIVLTDALGKVQKELQGLSWQDAGVQQLDVHINDFPNGLYHCLIKTESGPEYIKFLKIE